MILYQSCHKRRHENGALAQLGERYTGSVEVSGSIPLCSTTPSASVRRRVLEVLIFLHFFLSRLKTT